MGFVWFSKGNNCWAKINQLWGVGYNLWLTSPFLIVGGTPHISQSSKKKLNDLIFHACTDWYLISSHVPGIVGWIFRLNLSATYQNPNLRNLSQVLILVIPPLSQHWLVQRLNKRLHPCLNFLWWSSDFSPAKAISHAASGTGSSVATGIPWAACISSWICNHVKIEHICPRKAWK